MGDTALYLRLSKDDGTDISQSIVNQKNFLKDYAIKNGLEIYDVYADDGFSGINFERPAFKEMIKQIEQKNIKTILAKDLSRLGRDYIMTGHYIERYFPEHNVRFIAVNDNIDTFNSASTEYSPFKAVINDMYAKDISNKVRASLDTLKKQGYFIGAFAPFGYLKDPLKRGHLIIDYDNAKTIKKIYNLFLKGYSYKKIARYLDLANIGSPALKQGRNSNGWNDKMVKRILSNPTYAGHLTQNRNKKLSYKINKNICLPKELWITIENTHEAIIDEGTFQMVQLMILGRSSH